MTIYQRLVAQLHQIEADSPEQADRIVRIRAQAVEAVLRLSGDASAWAPVIRDVDDQHAALLDMLQDYYLLDETDDDPERVPRQGFIAADETTLPERLLAWRDAAVKVALDERDTVEGV